MEHLRKVEQAAERMDNLVRDALNYSWILRQDFVLRPVVLERLLRGLLESYPELESHRAEFSLALVRKAVERVGGKVGVESALGQSSRFWVD